MAEEAEILTEGAKEKKRTRKKQLYSNIKNLMEFYFSAANLTRDRWLSQSLDESGAIALTHFLSFNKVRALTNDINDIVKALRNSEILEVSEDYKVKRTTPLQYKDNVDECTIYVEQLPADANHDWLKNFFSCYGTIDYISIPKHFNSKKCKGFAFIEFSTPECAEKAIEEYKKAGRYLSNSIEPQELLSISTFDKKGSQQSNMAVDINSGQAESDLKVVKKRKNNVLLGDNSDSEGVKRIKLLEDGDECQDNLDSHIVQVPNPSEEEYDIDECGEGMIGNGDESKKKKNRKKKKKTKKNKITAETTGFQILSKKDWKYLRNKYLNIQREKMKKLKKHLKQQHIKIRNNRKSINANELNENSNDVETNKQDKTPISKDFIPGVIVRIEVTEPIINLKEFKAEVKNKSDDVKYIDVKEGAFCAFIRLGTPEDAKLLCEKSDWNAAEILKDEEEIDYWQKLEQARQNKLVKPSSKVKERGRIKMLKKAEKLLGKHIIFENTEDT